MDIYEICPNCGSDILTWLKMPRCYQCKECDSFFGFEEEEEIPITEEEAMLLNEMMLED